MPKNIVKFRPKKGYVEQCKDATRHVLQEGLDTIKDNRCGDIVFVAVILINEKSDVITHFDGEMHLFTAVGGLESLKRRLQNNYDWRPEDED